MRKALITGATGQDGVYLTELLLAEGYDVHAAVKPTSRARSEYRATFPAVRVWELDVRDGHRVFDVLGKVRPDEVYNLAGLSSVAESWGAVDAVLAVNVSGCANLLEGIRRLQDQSGQQIRYYQASSSEMFGVAVEAPQRETTPFHPRSPYGVSKAAAHFMTMNYRESYGMFAGSGILFNHESILRPSRFVSRKVTSGVAEIAAGQREYLTLGRLDVSRDWGYAPDYVRAMWLLLQAQEPDDFIVASGQSHTLRELLDVAFLAVGIRDWAAFVRHDPSLVRPAEVSGLVGDASKAQQILGWRPTVSFESMIGLMVEHDVMRLQHSSELHP